MIAPKLEHSGSRILRGGGSVIVNADGTISIVGNVDVSGATYLGGVTKIYVDNADTVTTESQLLIEQDGSGDAVLEWQITGYTTWFAYVDNSDGDKWKLRRSTTDWLTVTEAGLVTMAGALGVTGISTLSGGLTIAGDGGAAVGAIRNTGTSIIHQSGSSGWLIANSSNAYTNFEVQDSGNTSVRGTLTVTGALSKGSGSFKIDHPLPDKKDTHHLVHSFHEGPRADLWYRGEVALVSGSATVDLDEAAGMTEGTWDLLCRDPQVWVQNDSGWSGVRGSVEGNILTIECKDIVSDDTVSWMVVAERCDQHMIDTDWTDDEGRVIVEPEKPLIVEPEQPSG
jgi:hypothetical protein